MKKVLHIIWILFLVSCSASNYKTILDIKERHRKTENKSIILSHKGFNPSKIIFKKLDKSIGDDLVYIFSWKNNLPMASDQFKALVYDKRTSQTLYVGNNHQNKNDIVIKQDPNHYDEESLILKYYIGGKIEQLVSLKPQFSSSEVGTEYYLFDTKSNNAWVISNLILNQDGNVFEINGNID